MALVSFTRERGKKAAVFLLYEILLKRVFFKLSKLEKPYHFTKTNTSISCKYMRIWNMCIGRCREFCFVFQLCIHLHAAYFQVTEIHLNSSLSWQIHLVKRKIKRTDYLNHPTELLNGVRLHEFLLCVDTKVEQKHGLTTVGHCNKLN